MRSIRCEAKIYHGPGHQSGTRCRLTGNHEIHEAIYGRYDQFARWKGLKAFSGFFDEPPDNPVEENDSHALARAEYDDATSTLAEQQAMEKKWLNNLDKLTSGSHVCTVPPGAGDPICSICGRNTQGQAWGGKL
jgi:hypothetical protein